MITIKKLFLLLLVTLIFQVKYGLIIDFELENNPLLIESLRLPHGEFIHINGDNSYLRSAINSDGECCNYLPDGTCSEQCELRFRVYCNSLEYYTRDSAIANRGQNFNIPEIRLFGRNCLRSTHPGIVKRYLTILWGEERWTSILFDVFEIPENFPSHSAYSFPSVGFKNAVQINGFYILVCFPYSGIDCETLCVAERENQVCTGLGTLVCLPGTFGPRCRSFINFCALNLCQNDAICRNIVGGFRCICNRDSSGVLCEEPKCSLNNCINGVCMFGQGCQCTNDYTGEECNIFKCPQTHDSCQNGSQCDDSRNVRQCINCPSNMYAGYLCQYACNRPCINGVCIEAENRGLCICNEGFSGGDCSIAVSISICDNRPCQNGGSCTPDQSFPSLIYTCDCRENYRGDNCEEFFCSLDTCVHGVCMDHIGCACYEYSTGTNCEYIPCSVIGGNLCSNRGTCTNDAVDIVRCTCSRNFAGLNCEHRCPGDCSLNGRCTISEDGNPYCSCLNGFSGNNCQISLARRICAELDCKNGGRCIEDNESFRCRCLPSFSGADCSISACSLNNCFNGVCLDGQGCQCAQYYVGQTCENFFCGSNECANGETCIVINGNKQCICNVRENAGRFCEFKCKKTCIFGECAFDIDNVLGCKCSSGYYGPICDKKNVILPVRNAIIGLFTVVLSITGVVVALALVSIFAFKKEEKAEYAFKKTNEASIAGNLKWDSLKF